MLNSDSLIFILGSPRSGTTWIGKIFDSNPDVIYRHEPDVMLTGNPIPHICNDINQYKEQAIAYVKKLSCGSDVRSNGKPPIFSKSYRNTFLSAIRDTYIYALRYGGSVVPALNAWAIPDFTGNSQPRVVIKSVGALGRAGLFLAASPQSRFIHVLRHPCGHVGSVLRGQQLNKMRPFPLGFVTADTAAIYGMTQEKLEAMPVVEQAAWRWVILNHKAMQDTQGNPGVMTLVYEDLCAAPAEITRKLFAFAGLDWQPQTEAFLTSSTSSGEGRAYHSVYHDPLVAANKWRRELKQEEVSAIVKIVRDTPPGKLFTYD